MGLPRWKLKPQSSNAYKAINFLIILSINLVGILNPKLFEIPWWMKYNLSWGYGKTSPYLRVGISHQLVRYIQSAYFFSVFIYDATWSNFIIKDSKKRLFVEGGQRKRKSSNKLENHKTPSKSRVSIEHQR